MTTPASPAPSAKTCTRCGTDCNGKPRTKDLQGRYICQPCVDKQQAMQAAPKPEASGEQARASTAIADRAEPEGFNVFDLAPSANAAKVAPCPNCGLPVNEKAAVCVSCGYSKAHGRTLKESDVPKSADPPRGVRQQCKKCGYDLRGLKSAKCPECGTLNNRPTRRERDKETSVEVARETYRKPLIYLAIGLIGMFLIRGLEQGGGPSHVLGYALGYAIQLPIGLAVYWVCCLIWIGFDAPVHLTVLRLAGIYALVDLIGTVLGVVPILGGVIGWMLALFFYVGLLMDLLEMDLQDTIIVGLLTYLVKAMVQTFILLKLLGLI